MLERKGLLLVFLTAIVSGVSIFANSFAVQGFNPFVFTFLKNAVVAVFLISAIILLKEFKSIKAISGKQLTKLVAIGLIGGSIPFLLFFYALKLTTAVGAGFFHKTLFLWATVLALFFLKEKLDKNFILAALLLLSGNFLFFGIGSFGFPEMLILLATVLWAAETILSKHVLQELPSRIVAFGRMFFGSLFILAFLVLTGQISQALVISVPQIQWVLLSSAFLFAYVFTWYNGLNHLPVHKATAILLLAQPITAFLSLAFLGTRITLPQAFGLFLLTTGVFFVIGLGNFLHKAKSKGLSIAAARS